MPSAQDPRAQRIHAVLALHACDTATCCYGAGLLMVIQAAWLMSIGQREEGTARGDGHSRECRAAGNS
jgi:hypothetical protein